MRPDRRHIDPSDVTLSYAKSAKTLGASHRTHCEVLETNQRPDGTWDVVTMVADTDDEAILKDRECIGYVASGGHAHHVGKSIAMGYVPAALAVGGVEVETEILGNMHPARVAAAPLYDPDGGGMRS